MGVWSGVETLRLSGVRLSGPGAAFRAYASKLIFLNCSPHNMNLHDLTVAH